MLIGAGAAAAAGPTQAGSAPGNSKQFRPRRSSSGVDVIVVGAGVFGAWTAARLQAAGKRVLLLDAWGPAHARASSGGESRMTRGAYGGDEVYTRMALDSLADWRALSASAGLPLFLPTGVLFFFPRADPYALASLADHRRLGLPTEALTRAEMARRFPVIDFTGVEIGLLEPGFGVLMARRAVQTLVARFVAAGGAYETAQVLAPAPGAARLDGVRTADGRVLAADNYVFAAGPWLPRLFPDLLAGRITPTRQEVYFFAPPAGDPRYRADRLPGWADFNGGDLYYGMPDLEARGVKFARDTHGPVIDPDRGDRLPSPEALALIRAFIARRFPGLIGAQLTEARVCQYENSVSGDLLIDRHPRWPNTVLVGAGSGHGFKHGPAIGRYAAALVTGAPLTAEPRFSLATKALAGERAVH